MDEGFPHELLDDIQPLGPIYLPDAHFPGPSEGPGRGKAHEIDTGCKQNNEGNQKKNVYVIDFHPANVKIIIVDSRKMNFFEGLYGQGVF